jgi:hypothetical protein
VNILKFINCYEGFDKIYNEKLSKDELIDVWFQFMGKFESVRDMCIQDYVNDNLNWKQIAKDRVFIYNADYVLKMNETVRLIKEIVLVMKKRLSIFYSIDSIDTHVIVYHGLGNAAGWLSIYEDQPAIFLGVEKIVELGWNSSSKLEDLISHEYGHLLHLALRGTLTPYNDFKKKMIFRLYTEGVATYCESIFNGREKSSPEWYELCLKNEVDLKKEFLIRLNSSSKECFDFFGDWNPVFGIYEAGYFLGLQVVKSLMKKMTIKELMVIKYNMFLIEFNNYFEIID